MSNYLLLTQRSKTVIRFIRKRIFFKILLPFILIYIAGTWFIADRTLNYLDEAIISMLNRKGKTLVQRLKNKENTAILNDEVENINNLLNEYKSYDTDIKEIIIVKDNGAYFGGTTKNIDSIPYTKDILYTEKPVIDFNIKGDENSFRIHYPLGLDSFTKNYIVTFKMNKKDLNIAHFMIQTFMIAVSLFTLVVGVYIYAQVIKHYVLRPVNKIARASQRIFEGYYDSEINLNTIDEFKLLVNTFNRMTKHLDHYTKHLGDLVNSYSRFVPHEFLSILDKEDITKVNLGDQIQKEMTILFSDIRGFTSISENMTPQENFNFLNSFLSKMEPIILKNNGFIDKYIGDAIMALFPKNPDDAILSAILMQKEVKEHSHELLREGYTNLKIGIGINVGLLMLGTVGGRNRMDGTVISDAVNLASRIENLTKTYKSDLLISAETVGKLNNPDQFKMRIVDRVIVKGKSKPVLLYEIYNSDHEDIQSLKDAMRDFYEEGYSHFCFGEYNEALSYFEKCQAIYPKDAVVKLYIKRCHTLIAEPNSSEGIFLVQGMAH